MTTGFKFALKNALTGEVLSWGAGEADDIASALRAAKKNHLRGASATARFSLNIVRTDGTFADLGEVADIGANAPKLVAFGLQCAINEITGRSTKDTATDTPATDTVTTDTPATDSTDNELSVTFES